MNKTILFVAILSCLSTTLLLRAVAPAPRAFADESVGRYQLHVDDGNIHVADTTTGQVFRWTRNRKGELGWLIATKKID
jgi:hypothetical protein